MCLYLEAKLYHSRDRVSNPPPPPASPCYYSLQKSGNKWCDGWEDEPLAHSMMRRFPPHAAEQPRVMLGVSPVMKTPVKTRLTNPRTSAPLRLLPPGDVNKLTLQTASRGKETAASPSPRLPPPALPSLPRSSSHPPPPPSLSRQLAASQTAEPINPPCAWAAALWMHLSLVEEVIILFYSLPSRGGRNHRITL